MKVGAVGLGNRAAHVFFELKKINPNYSLVAFVDPQPIGKKFSKEKNIFPTQEYSSLEEYLDENDASRIFATTSKAKKVYSDINYKVGDTLLFGPEDLGLPKDIYKKIRNSIRIPMQPNNRSLNLSNSVAIVAYEAWRQLNFCE